MSETHHRAIPEVTELACRLAYAAGLSHDLGKAGSYFVEKLAKAARGARTEPDPVRHEWISMCLVEKLISGQPLNEAFRSLTSKALLNAEVLLKGVRSANEALIYISATHHRLLGPVYSQKQRALTGPDASRHILEPLPPFQYPLSAKQTLSPALASELSQELADLKRAVDATECDEPFWYGLAWWSRVALILADQGISSVIHGECSPDGARRPIAANTPGLYANTWPKAAEVPGQGV